MKKIKTAVIGTGRLGGFHAQKLAASEKADLIAVADPCEANRTRVAEQNNTEAVEDFTKLLGRIDAAVVATPTTHHHAVVRHLLEEGVHVMVEKPITTTVAQAEELIDLADRNGLVFAVGHVERFNPAFQPVATSVTSPKYIETTRCGPFSFRSTDVGVVLDLMIHDIDLILSLTKSKPSRVEALGFSVLGGHEDVANARIHFECGCVANLNASRVSYKPVRAMHVWSMDGFAAIDFGARQVDLVSAGDEIRERRFDVDALTTGQVEACRENFFKTLLPQSTESFEAVDALALEDDDFLTAILKSRQPRVTGRAGRDALAVAYQILEAVDSHAWTGDTQATPTRAPSETRRAA